MHWFVPSFSLSLNTLYSDLYYLSILQILMNVLALHTTAIHKQDVRTQLEDSGASAEMATLEMVLTAMVGSHSVNYDCIIIRYSPFHHEDIDECTRSTHNCHPKARCQNTVGGFRCICRNGYTGNGIQCSGRSSQCRLCHSYSYPLLSIPL